MDTKGLAKKLSSLMQLHFDAARAYEDAINKIDPNDQDIRANLTVFRDDHNRHIADLSKAVSALGEEPPKISRDIKGFLIEGMTSAMSAMGTNSALKAMQKNERLTNKTYSQAVSDPDFAGYPSDIRMLLQKNYDDEKRHLSYIEAALKAPAAAGR
jgi:hypothetical protein